MSASRTDPLTTGLRQLAQTTTRGALKHCAKTGKIMFTTSALAGGAVRLLQARRGGRRYTAVQCGRNNHYHVLPEGDKL